MARSYYVVTSESPIAVRPITRPDFELPGWTPEQGGPGLAPGQGLPWRPSVPEDWERPELPPREDWPPLPPFLQPGVGLPIPPSVENPWVPAVPPPDLPDQSLPPVWPPLPDLPALPDLSGKTLILARFYVSRHVNFLRWVVVDHAEAKSKIERALQWIKDHLPAGGIGGRPPDRPTPSR